MFENKVTIKRLQDFILDVDGSNDTIKVILGRLVGHP